MPFIVRSEWNHAEECLNTMVPHARSFYTEEDGWLANHGYDSFCTSDADKFPS